MLLNGLGVRSARAALAAAAQAVNRAFDSLLANSATRTADLGGRRGTRKMTRQGTPLRQV